MGSEGIRLIIAMSACLISFIGFVGVLYSLFLRIKIMNEIKLKISQQTASQFFDRFPSWWGENTAVKNIKKIAPHINKEINTILKSQKVFIVSLLMIVFGCGTLLNYPF